MKISIDTKEDSHDEIRKVIKMLQHLVGDASLSNQSSGPSYGTEATSAFGAIFGAEAMSAASAPASPSPAAHAVDDYGIPLDMNQKVEETPEIVPY